MTKRALLLCPLVALLGLSTTREASAAGWIDSAPIYSSTSCVHTSSAQKVVSAYTGYDTDVIPRAGQVAYIHASSWNVNGCYQEDYPNITFILPPGASLAVSPSTPVYCFRGKNDGSFWEQVPNVAGQSECVAAPVQVGNRVYAGYSVLPSQNSQGPGWFLEIQIPIIFANPGTYTIASDIFSPAGVFPNGMHTGMTSINMYVSSASTPPPPPPPTAPMFANLAASSSAYGDAVNFSFSIGTSFQVGVVSVEWGTSTSLGSEITIGNSDAQWNYYPALSGAILNTPSATMIYWRPKFVVAGTAFYGPMQSVRTNAYPIGRPIPFPPRCRGFCPA